MRPRRRASILKAKKTSAISGAMIMHGDDDQIVPIGASALLSSARVRGSTLKIYAGLSHGMCTLNKDQINTDLLAFIQA